MNPSPLHELAQLGETVSKAVAMISVPNVSQSLAWYESIGFTVLNVFEERGVMNFAMVALGHAQIMLSLGESGSLGVSLWLYTDKVDELYEAFKKRQTELQDETELPAARRIEFAEHINDTFYHARQFGICSPDGYILYFIRNLPH
jgi:hypothetical protein